MSPRHWPRHRLSLLSYPDIISQCGLSPACQLPFSSSFQTLNSFDSFLGQMNTSLVQGKSDRHYLSVLVRVYNPRTKPLAVLVVWAN